LIYLKQLVLLYYAKLLNVYASTHQLILAKRKFYNRANFPGIMLKIIAKHTSLFCYTEIFLTPKTKKKFYNISHLLRLMIKNKILRHLAKSQLIKRHFNLSAIPLTDGNILAF